MARFPTHAGAHDWITLYHMAKRRLDSPDAYRAFQHFQGELLVRYLQSRGVDLKGRWVLDLACGLGGYCLALQDHGANVLGADLVPPADLPGAQTVCADARSVPFRSESMDLVICASLIEHVPIPTDVIRETLRVLKPGGFVYLSFPPFYTPLGGHQFSPFHLLGQRFALRVNSIRKQYHGKYWLQERYPIQPVSFAQAFGGWGLYPLTIAKVERILAIFPIETVDRSTRWLPLDFSGLPLLREFLTWHVQFLFRKR